MFPMADKASLRCVFGDVYVYFLEVYVSSQTVCARRIGPGSIARMMKELKARCLGAYFLWRFGRLGIVLGRVLHFHIRRLWWWRFFVFLAFGLVGSVRVIWRLRVRWF